MLFALETISLHVTDNNNLSVPGRVTNADELSTGEIYRLLNESSDLGTKYLVIDGGEPLIRKDIFDILNYANDLGLSMEFYTNGTLITPDVAEKMFVADVNSVLFNMDYADRSRFDRHSGVEGSYDNVISGMRALRKYPIFLGISTIVTPDNVNELDALMKVAIDEGLNMIRFVPRVSDSSRGSTAGALSQQDWADITAAVVKCVDAHVDDIVYVDYRILPESLDPIDFLTVSCNAGITWLNIFPDGSVRACPFLPAENANLKETSLKDVWFNHFNAIRTIQNESLPGRCKNCASISCRGGCVAERMSGGGISGEQKICMRDVLKEGITDFDSMSIRKLTSGWYHMLYFKNQCCVRNIPVWVYPLKMREKHIRNMAENLTR